jgi:thiamine pyrophosphate-dependent acetolactate synthase large subunit-like protein
MNERTRHHGDWSAIPGPALQYYIDRAFTSAPTPPPTAVYVGIEVDVLEPDHDSETNMFLQGLGLQSPQQHARTDGGELL